MERKPAKLLIMLSMILFVLSLLVWGLRICSAGGLATYLVEEGLVASLLCGLQCIVCLFLVFWIWFYYRPKLRREENAKGRKGVGVALCAVIGLCLLLLAYHHSPQGNRMVSGEVPYISQGVLPLMEQLEEETPDFSVQQPVKNGFVDIDSNFFAPTYLILRQDGGGGEWYHILYTELRRENLAEVYAGELAKGAEKEGWTLQPVDGGLSWIAEYPQEGKEAVLLFHQGNVVVKVTYHGSKDLVSRAAAWEAALFSEAE